jgi:cellulose synthase/poly-beta-1,6-N-acetylglucosamine synthase-like glycosyltransferase
MTLAIIVITLIYLFIIGRFVLGFDKISDFQLEDLVPKSSFTIVVPFRNEARNLPNLLRSLSALNYPRKLLEFILIDDDSTDESVKLINEFNSGFRLIKNKRKSASPKKDAIATAIDHSKHDWIVTTDADCIFNEDWLITLDAFIQQKQPRMIVGPVTYSNNDTFLKRFQLLDFLSLIGATIGGFGINKPFLCNGANLAYSKQIFIDVKGFKGNDHISSGDDIFLMEKIVRKYPFDVAYIKHQNAIVKTTPETKLSGLIAQRRRWAAKTSSYSHKFGKIVGAIVLLMNFSLLAGLFLSIFGVYTIKTIGYVFLIKFCIDLWLIYKTTQFMNQTKYLKSYFLSSLLYPFFNVYIAISSWYSGYTWKGRKFNK